MTTYNDLGCSECANYLGPYCGHHCEYDPATNRGSNFRHKEIAVENDAVNHPNHYTRLPIETIKAIKLLVTEAYGDAGYKGYCFGNELKYRLRAGFKGPAEEDIGKSLKYEKFRNNDFE